MEISELDFLIKALRKEQRPWVTLQMKPFLQVGISTPAYTNVIRYSKRLTRI